MASKISELFKSLDFDKLVVGADGRPQIEGKDIIDHMKEQGIEIPDEMLKAASNWNACNATGCSGVV